MKYVAIISVIVAKGVVNNLMSPHGVMITRRDRNGITSYTGYHKVSQLLHDLFRVQ